MKVYACPTEVVWNEDDLFGNGPFNHGEYEKRQKEHQAALVAWAKRNGYTGKNTGKMLSFGVADGSAEYMLIEGKTSFLFHMPYMDAYHYRGIEHMTKKGIMEEINRHEKLAALWAKQKAK